MSLAARNLAFGYGATVIGRDVGLCVEAGRALAILGPNGGGKTTLMRTLLGLLPSLGGEALLDGRPLPDFSIPQRARRLAYVPQSANAVFAYTVRDVVLMGRTVHAGLLGRPGPADRRHVERALERLGIAHLAERAFTMVSGGERQLVMVARALAQDAGIVVLDEPTASLDFGNQGRVMEEVRALTQSGLAVLFTTHDPNQALRFADDALLLRDGTQLQYGAVADVLTRGNLETLYGTGVDEVIEGQRRVFLPRSGQARPV